MAFNEYPYGKGSQSVSEMADCNNECPHGRLPHDPSPPCGCWKGLEPGVVIALPPVVVIEAAA